MKYSFQTMHPAKILFVSVSTSIFFFSDLTRARRKDVFPIPRRHPTREFNIDETHQSPGWTSSPIPNIPTVPNGEGIPTISKGEGIPTMLNKIPTVPSEGKVPTMPGGMPNMPNNRGNIQPPSSTRAHMLSKSRNFNVNSRNLNSDSRINPTIPGIPGLPNQPDFPSFPEKPKNNTGNMTESEIPGVVIPAYAMKIE
ncbi:hypothetical protein TNCT_541131 [Trichonephila clavata]|uniref:Uncharacterized protein n=1 Tax=Trichonephila clavata TaxID=2740835 RepID=A0A8X6H3R9_TRICU|nr:hypothetical protein TNCT_541131 [Trichonephila clavata]